MAQRTTSSGGTRTTSAGGVRTTSSPSSVFSDTLVLADAVLLVLTDSGTYAPIDFSVPSLCISRAFNSPGCVSGSFQTTL